MAAVSSLLSLSAAVTSFIFMVVRICPAAYLVFAQ